jgi:hypothetical protein
MLRHAAGQDDTPITAAAGLRSSVENRWRAKSHRTAVTERDRSAEFGLRPGALAQIPVLMLFVTRSGYFAAATSGRGADGLWPEQPQGH